MNDLRYFHVRLSTRSKPDAPEFEFDLTLEEVTKRFIEPYNMGEPIVTNGKTVPMDNLEQLRIGSTNLHSDQVNSAFRAEALAKRNVYPVNPRGRVSAQIIFERAVDETSRFVTRPPGSNREESSGITQASSADPKAVFVVQGRNAAANAALDTFLRVIELRPIEWPHATRATATGTPYIGHTLDAAFSNAHAVIVLFTPDDEVMLRPQLWGESEPEYEKKRMGQPRPNVIHEAGKAMERFPTRTVIVELGNLRPFSDISGLHTVRMDNSIDRRRDLADRLQAIGCAVNLDNRAWHTAGDFEAAVADDQASSADTENSSNIHTGAPQLSQTAKRLLLAASKDKLNRIVAVRTMAGRSISSNGEEFAEAGNRRQEAEWENALNQLVDQGLVQDAGTKSEIFELTHQGFIVADRLNSEPD